MRQQGQSCAEARGPQCTCWCRGAAHGKSHAKLLRELGGAQMSHKMSVVFDDDLHEAIGELAVKDGRTFGVMVNRLLAQAIAHGVVADVGRANARGGRKGARRKAPAKRK